MRRLAAIMALVSNGTWAQATMPAVDDYVMPPNFAGAALSPSGRYVAIKVLTKSSGRIQLAVMETSGNAPKIVAGYSDVDIGDVQWVNDGRLMFNIASRQAAQNAQFQNTGLMTVERDGSQLKKISDFESGTQKLGVSATAFMLRGPVAQDSEHVYLGQWHFDQYGAGGFRGIDLVRVNTNTGVAELVKSPGVPYRWALDTKGEPRVVVTDDGGNSTLHIRDSASGAWRKLLSFPGYAGSRGSVDPVLLDANGPLYVRAHGGKDAMALYAVNPVTGGLDAAPLVKLDGYDLDGGIEVGGGKLLGMHYETDAPGTVWFDPAMQAVQLAVDTLLPGKVNVLSLPRRPETPIVLVESFSDQQPKTYLLYNKDSKALMKIGSMNDRIDPARQGRRDAMRIKARDGLEMPAWLTLPHGGGTKGLPLIVLAHDGPWQRGSWGWDSQVQFLASRGYAVLQPDFRGSTGYGLKHFEAGIGQWGRAMQDDLADAAKWAVAQGIADPKRICIAGYGHGGYAVLMGLARDPGLYACGVAWASITDIGIVLRTHWRHYPITTGQWKQYNMRELVGDSSEEPALLQAVSPLAQARRIRAPLLLAHGGRDELVPVSDARRFKAAVQTANTQVEWIEYEDEGHGWHDIRTRIDFWKRVDAFLARHLAAKP